MTIDSSRRDESRRAFLKYAGVMAGAVATTTLSGCEVVQLDSKRVPKGDAPADTRTPRNSGFDRGVLDALAMVVLPDSIGFDAQRAAVGKFVAWIDGYDPVAEEMHGYGYADIRYLPPDPAPNWRAQLEALETLARKTRNSSFTALDTEARREVIAVALRRERLGERLPSPLGAPHIAVALLAHWASTPQAWNVAFGANVSPETCRPLADANHKPLPIASTGNMS